MRKWLSIVFVLSLTAPFLGVFGWFYMEKQLLRKEIKHQLMSVTSNDELILLQFKKEDTLTHLNWKHSKEFEYKGEMYDVVRRSYTKNSVSYYLWWDHEETKLNQKLGQLTASIFDQSPEKKRSSQQYSFFLSQLFIEQQEELLYPKYTKLQNHYFTYQDLFSEVIITVATPPPAAQF